MKNEWTLFSAEQGNLLIRLILAHIISDFVLQTSKIVQNKKWFSGYMALHILIVLASTFLLSGLWKVSIGIALLHWLADAVKVTLQSKTTIKSSLLFITDQLFHLIVIAIIWLYYINALDRIVEIVSYPFLNYTFSLILLGYIWLIYPVGFLIKFATQNIAQNNSTGTQTDVNVEHGGKLIGQFERIIILTLVLLNQYEAIGFLITGKSIIRFADHNSNLRSEYVLVGTMMSYALAILTGVCINYLLAVLI